MNCCVIYKDLILPLKKYPYENNAEFHMRKWYVMKNIHLTHEYFPGKNDHTDKPLLSYNELVQLSRTYIQITLFQQSFHKHIMDLNDILVKNLFI
jgi:hypothetical protein